MISCGNASPRNPSRTAIATEILDLLDDRQRQIVLAVESGCSVRRIAAELQTTPYLLDKELGRIRERLRGRLDLDSPPT